MLLPKPAVMTGPRSIILNFLEFYIIELVLLKMWQQKIQINHKGLYFDRNYSVSMISSEIMERHRCYGPFKAPLKEKNSVLDAINKNLPTIGKLQNDGRKKKHLVIGT